MSTPAAPAPSSRHELTAGVVTVLCATIFLWGSAFVGTRAVLESGGYTPYRLAFLRYLVASLVLLLVAAWFRPRIPKMADMPRLLACGFLGVAVYNALLNLGQSMVKAGAASFIVNTIPMFTALLSVVLLKDRITRMGWVGMITSFLGVILIAVGEGKGLELNHGALVILVAALAWSGATILQKPLLSRYKALEIVSYSVWIGTLLLAVFIPGALHELRTAPSSATITMIYLGVFPAALAYLGWTVVLSKMPASRASSFLYVVPLISTLTAVVWLREIPTALSLVGGCIAIGGIIITNTLGRRVAKEKPQG